MDADDDFRFEMGSAWLDLLSTVYGRRRDHQYDRLYSQQRLDDWLAAVGQQPQRRPDTDDLALAHDLRADLYLLARAAADKTPVPRATVQKVNAMLAADTPPRLSAGVEGLRASRPADTRCALARIARQAVDQLTGPHRPRLRACDDDTCAGIFVDDSGRRRWCNDTRCGSRARVRAHRARTAGAATRK